jgi:predicted AAA+ superfamily ATPase
MNRIEAIHTARADIAGLAVFASLRNQTLLRSFKTLLDEVIREAEGVDLLQAWAAFSGALLREGGDYSFYSCICFLTINDDNPFTRYAEAAVLEQIPEALRSLAAADLSRLGRLAAFDLAGLGSLAAERLRKAGLGGNAAAVKESARLLGRIEPQAGQALPVQGDWGKALPELAAYLRGRGAGELGLYHFFYWVPGENARSGSLRPVFHPDPIRIADLSGYEDQRSIVTANTRRFIEKKNANNILLYGDRGTGKSATVKAVCAEYADRGLKLVEIHKRDLQDLPELMELLSSRMLRFIVFIDDLSFETTDDSFTTLKALLEGCIGARPSNIVIYATSNRRHLVKERMEDRPTTAMAAEAVSTGDVRAFDTMQEQFSLADRFGVTVVFTAPNQEEYLSIACFIARQRGLLNDADEAALKQFRDNALRWERWFNGRSPRTAVQYVEWAAGGTDFPWEEN